MTITTATFTADTTTVIPNPERGHSTMIGNLTDVTPTHVSNAIAAGNRLLTHREDISAYYQTATIPGAFLTELTTCAGYHRSGGTKMVLGFSYDNDGTGTTEAARSIMLGHIQQLGDWIKDNEDVICRLHAGFVGTYGEWASWHVPADSEDNPCSGNPPDQRPTASLRAAVKDQLLASIPKRIPICFRVPMWPMDEWGLGASPPGAAQAFNGSWQTRLTAQHNDCWLRPPDDLGTYWKCGEGGNTRNLDNRFRAWHNAVAEWAGTSGENCGSGLGTYDDAYIDIQRYRWVLCRTDWGNFWHADYGGGTPSITTSAQSKTLLNMLGYRIQLDGISHENAATTGSTVTFTVTLRNTGCARVGPTSERRLWIRMVNGGTTLTGKSVQQLRQLPSQATQTSTFKVDVAIPGGAATGTYNVYIEMPDCYSTTESNTYYHIKPANTGTYSSGRFTTTTSVSVT